jgi:hypothetical protein
LGQTSTPEPTGGSCVTSLADFESTAVVQCGPGYGLAVCPALGALVVSNYTACDITCFDLDSPFRLTAALGRQGKGASSAVCRFVG